MCCPIQLPPLQCKALCPFEPGPPFTPVTRCPPEDTRPADGAYDNWRANVNELAFNISAGGLPTFPVPAGQRFMVRPTTLAAGCGLRGGTGAAGNDKHCGLAGHGR